MKRIQVLDNADCILIGQSITNQIVSETIETVPASFYVLISDFNVASFGHFDKLANSFEEALKERESKVLKFLIPPGESAKTREMKSLIEDFLLSEKCTRDTCLIAFGGGVLGDMVGFVASTFMRGIPVIQVPTTLLAMVDSSIGGKTAVDTKHGKNLIGAFHQPKRIFMDIDYLKTLPKREFVNGMAEVIKTAAIWSEKEFEHLETFCDQILDNSRDSNPELLQAIIASAKTKAHVVTVDEKESGLRGLLNFGHTVGHAIEAIMSPQLLHGECVSLGMVREAEISRNLGHLKDAAVGRLVRCLQAFGLYVTLDDKKIKSLTTKQCSVEDMMSFMSLDKKNQGSKKRLVLLKAIGKTLEPKASIVGDQIIRNCISPSIFVSKFDNDKSQCASLSVPGSKSISNRALVLAALGSGECRIKGLLNSDDVQVMLNALNKLVGIQFKWLEEGEVLVINGGSGKLRVPNSELYLGNAGTASRFLTSVCSLIKADSSFTILTGNPRMKQRPIGPLVDALKSNDCDIDYLESKGSLPLKIKPKGLKGGEIHLSASVSSQYVSSILMAAPYASNPVTLVLDGDQIVSQPYIDMTLAMMESFGVKVERLAHNIYKIPVKNYENPSEYQIEADASSATYPLAFAAITGTQVTVTNIGSRSLQGDAEFAIKVLKPMGCQVIQTENTTLVKGPRRLSPIASIDMETMTDAFLTASVLAAVASGTTKIYGIANQRVKECDRIHAMVEQLARFGVEGKEFDDGLEIYGLDLSKLKAPEDGVKCYDDHRVAMSFSLLSLLVQSDGGAIVNEKKCVEKTWPGWWDTLQNTLGAKLVGVDHLVHQQTAKKLGSDSNKSIVLIGMRGVGKTSTGTSLSSALHRRFIDMDEYLENELGLKIPQVIEKHGWEYFREKEFEFLKSVLESYPNNCIIACGGGIVETESSRLVLKDWISSKGCVIHLKRDMDKVIEYLSIDKSRPSFSLDLMQVWTRRKPFYEECSSAEWSLDPSDDGIEKLINFVSFVTGTQSFDSKTMKYFVSCTLPNIESQKIVLNKMVQGADAIELRVDLLCSTDYDFVMNQLNLLRRYLNEYLAVIFTVRTRSQGGQFPNENIQEMFQLIKGAIKNGCEFVDLEILPYMDTFYTEQIQEVCKMKGNTRIIASFHDVKGEYIWNLPTFSALSSNANLEKTSPKRLDSLMSSMYYKLSKYGDVVKLISVANSKSDNFELEMFVKSFKNEKPLIAINMGRLGQVTRVLNQFLTPVTHPDCPTPAAPGQLSIAEINQCNYLLGNCPKKNFYLFGDPIAHSMSPTLHNTAFKSTGLSHKYSLYSCNLVEQVKNVIEQDSSFGGASVTIPLKEECMKLVHVKTEAANAIGSINTIIPRVVDSKVELIGDNTDWIAMYSLIQKNIIGSSIGIVLGAGGTARAALYVLKKLNCTKIYIWNRTKTRSDQLAAEFNVESIDSIEFKGHGQFIIINTVPGDCQESLNLPNVSEVSGCFVEMAMKPKETRLVHLLKPRFKIIYGIQVLLEQGYSQFYKWTGIQAPRLLIEEKVIEKYGLMV